MSSTTNEETGKSKESAGNKFLRVCKKDLHDVFKGQLEAAERLDDVSLKSYTEQLFELVWYLTNKQLIASFYNGVGRKRGGKRPPLETDDDYS